MKRTLLLIMVVQWTALAQHAAIDRHALVSRHNVTNTSFDTLSSFSVGNGELAFTVDATGLQTFPDLYEHSIPLGTQSQWGWHRFPNDSAYSLHETFKQYDFHGRSILYPVEWNTPERKKLAAQWLRQNPHRLHLGTIGFEIRKADGTIIIPSDIRDIKQTLDLWTGTIVSTFKVEGNPVVVQTCCHPDRDLISARIISPLISSGQLSVSLRFSYPTGMHTDGAWNWNNPKGHLSEIIQNEATQAVIKRTIDSAAYFVSVRWKENAALEEAAMHSFRIRPYHSDTLELSCLFSQSLKNVSISNYDTIQAISNERWHKFWISGGAVDFSGSTDPRAWELERRVILSQYLLRIQCSGSLPPQETGLTYNSWFGKFHLEMYWWHIVHNALWGRIDLLEKSLGWYTKILPSAQRTAQGQGFAGARWPKMTDPSGNDSPSNVGPFLIWQQPHPIYFAELMYRYDSSNTTLYHYKDLVFATAEFMASYAWYDSLRHRYVLGPTLIPAQERFDPAMTINPSFELAYWHWGLATAQSWRVRLHLPREQKWDDVLAQLSPLSQSDGLYLAAESAPDSYTNPRFMTDHPSVLAAYGLLPWSLMIDTTIIQRTFDFILNHWDWASTWGWDYPMMAMTATRLGLPERAIEVLLKDTQKNTFLKNGHNYQDDRLRIYLPGNGGLLTAVAIMCAGYNGCTREDPGIPSNGRWKVRWENLQEIE